MCVLRSQWRARDCCTHLLHTLSCLLCTAERAIAFTWRQCARATQTAYSRDLNRDLVTDFPISTTTFPAPFPVTGVENCHAKWKKWATFRYTIPGPLKTNTILSCTHKRIYTATFLMLVWERSWSFSSFRKVLASCLNSILHYTILRKLFVSKLSILLPIPFIPKRIREALNIMA